MNYKKFFRILSKLHNPDFDKNGTWKTKYGVKYYCQAGTFSYAVYTQENAYHGISEYKSQIFYNWENKQMRKIIINDIKQRI